MSASTAPNSFAFGALIGSGALIVGLLAFAAVRDRHALVATARLAIRRSRSRVR